MFIGSITVTCLGSQELLGEEWVWNYFNRTNMLIDLTGMFSEYAFTELVQKRITVEKGSINTCRLTECEHLGRT